jgi:hypothetical protein
METYDDPESGNQPVPKAYRKCCVKFRMTTMDARQFGNDRPGFGLVAVSTIKGYWVLNFAIQFLLIAIGFFLGSNSFPNLNAGNVPLSSFLTGPRV